MSKSSTSSASDESFLRQAIRLAERSREHTAPNPRVGCVIVKRGRVVAHGVTRPPGGDHAEIVALKRAGRRAKGATVYVTLEPCNHVGRTGPCTEALIRAGVARVVCGIRDPNPRVAGGGLKKLRAEKISVESGVCAEECKRLHAAWLHWLATGRPLVTMKAAITLDGRIATRSGDSKWVSGEESRKEAHRLRDTHDAILVGARTVALDDPRLTTRLPGGHDPIRIVLDGKLTIRPSAQVLPALVATHRKKASPALERAGAELVTGWRTLRELLERLGRGGIQTLLVEGGGQVHGALLAAGLVDRVALFIAPKVAGSDGVPLAAIAGPRKMADAWKLREISTRRLGSDILVLGVVDTP